MVSAYGELAVLCIVCLRGDQNFLCALPSSLSFMEKLLNWETNIFMLHLLLLQMLEDFSVEICI